MIQVDDLLKIATHCPRSLAELYVPHYQRATTWAEILTPYREAAWIAQLLHESAEFRYMEEIADGHAYEGRRDIGNVQPGDGRRFKGRGPIQLTGRTNYTAASAALGIDLVNHPERASLPDVGFLVSAWYWREKGLNALAYVGGIDPFKEITRRINGGLNGWDSRLGYYKRAWRVLGCQ